LRYVGGSPFLNTFSQSNSPLSTKYNTSPSSPCVITFSPALYFFSSKESITVFNSLSSKELNKKLCEHLSVILFFCSSVFGITLGINGFFIL
jgi:hypothetical protein